MNETFWHALSTILTFDVATISLSSYYFDEIYVIKYYNLITLVEKLWTFVRAQILFGYFKSIIRRKQVKE